MIANDAVAMAQTLLGMLKNPTQYQPRKFVKQQADVQLMAKSYADLRTSSKLAGVSYE